MAKALATATERRTESLRGADLVCIALERCGVDVVFGYPGGACLPIYDAIPAHPSIHHVLVRHEQGAAHMADGYARATGRVGVCLVTSGPGATNLVTGLANAYMDSVPLVAITGQVATTMMGRDAFQETDVLGMVAPITKHAFLPRTADEIVPAIERAMRIARAGRPGPVVVDIPKDAQNQTARDPGASADPEPRPALPESLDDAAAMLGAAERPVIVAGHGVRLARAHAALRELAERLDAPVATTLLGIGAFPEDHELALGMIGMHGSAATNRAVNAADVLLAVGMRFDDRATGKVAAFAPNARIVHIDVDPTQIGKNVPTALGIVADARDALHAILERVPRREHPAWRAAVAARAQAPRPRLEAFEARVALAPRPVVRALREVAAADAYFVADVGQHQMWAAQHLRVTHPDRFITSGGLGAMGFALPAALGVQFGRPGSEVWAIAGDGGFQMTFQELGTAAQERLPVKVVVMNNGYLGMVRQWQQLFYDGRISQTPISSPDYVKIAEAYGAFGAVVDDRRALRAALERARDHDGPAVVDVRIEREANVWPIVPPGGANADTMEAPR